MTKSRLAIIFAPKAEKNLEDIRDYIEGKGTARAADSVVEKILDACSALREMPKIGKVRDELAPDVRSTTSGKYVIYYRSTENSIDILRIWHSRRDIVPLKNEL